MLWHIDTTPALPRREHEVLLGPKYEWNEWDQQAFDMQERLLADAKEVDVRLPHA